MKYRRENTGKYRNTEEAYKEPMHGKGSCVGEGMEGDAQMLCVQVQVGQSLKRAIFSTCDLSKCEYPLVQQLPS